MIETTYLAGAPAEVHMIVRILTAYIIAGIIGWDREQRERSAGLRTHLLVATGAAAFTVAAIYGFAGPNGTMDSASRIVAQIVSGIGFVGAGVIWHSPDQRSRGLTTAAGVWLTAAIGVLAGAGLIFMATFVGALAWFTLRVLRSLKPQVRQQKVAFRAQEQQPFLPQAPADSGWTHSMEDQKKPTPIV